MKVKVVERCPRSGKTIEKWVDKGPGSALVGHGRPMVRLSGPEQGSVAGAKQSTLGSGGAL